MQAKNNIVVTLVLACAPQVSLLFVLPVKNAAVYHCFDSKNFSLKKMEKTKIRVWQQDPYLKL